MKNAKLVVVYDYNDGYDQVFAFAERADADAMLVRNAASYAGTHYEALADKSGKVLNEAEAAWFVANYEMPAVIAAGGFDAAEAVDANCDDELFDWLANAPATTVECFDDVVEA